MMGAGWAGGPRSATRKVEALVVDERQAYVLTLLETYRSTPGTTGTVRRPDRLLVGQLYDRGIPMALVQNALLLASARRLFGLPHAPPLAIIRSLAYYLDIIEEVRGLARLGRRGRLRWLAKPP